MFKRSCGVGRARGTRWTWFALLVAALSLAAGCGGKSDEEIEAELAATKRVATGKAVAKAQEVYVTRCTPCHGEKGHGDGTASATLDPKPRDFQDPAWQKSVTDEHIMNIIKVGGAGVGKSAAMPSNPDLQDKAVLAALKDHVRGFAKP